jgi:hypothetical protein
VEHRWLLPGEDVQTEPLSIGVLRLFRSDWDHDCLDVDIQQGTATHRRQGDDTTGSPGNWDTQPCALRLNGRQWEIQISGDDIARWIEAQAQLVALKTQFARANPQFDIREEIERATSTLHRLRKMDVGWNALADDVGQVINAWQAQSSFSQR